MGRYEFTELPAGTDPRDVSIRYDESGHPRVEVKKRMVAYPANEQTEREVRAWALQTVMFAVNVQNRAGGISLDNLEAWYETQRQYAVKIEEQLWNEAQAEGPELMLNFVERVFAWCRTPPGESLHRPTSPQDRAD